MSYNNIFREIWIIDDRYDVSWTYTYLPFWWQIRKRYVDSISKILEWLYWYEEMHFPDLISQNWIDIMSNTILDVKSKISKLSDFNSVWIAPTHEIPINIFLSNYIVNESQLPFKFFHLWTVYRKNNNSTYPYWLAEKRSFMEFHSVFPNYKELEDESDKIVKIMWEIINNIFIMPNIFSERPLITNNPISKKTLCYDSITKFGKTQISWMIYQHWDIFSKPFNVKYRLNWSNKKKYVKTLHFWFTDNLLLSIIINSIDNWRLILPDILMPYQVWIVYNNDNDEFKKALDIQKKLNEQNIRTKLFCNNWKKSVYNLLEKQNPYFIVKVWKMWKITFSNLEWEDNIEFNNEFWEYYVDKKERRRLSILNKKEEIENTSIVKYWKKVNLEVIKEQIKKWKICDIALLKDNNIILDIEKNYLKNWEIIWFYDSNSDWNCVLSWINTVNRAFLSKRF